MFEIEVVQEIKMHNLC